MSDSSMIQVGDRLKDNDPRMLGRAPLVVTDVAQDHVSAKTGYNQLVRIKRTRIFTDGKTRRYGMSLLPRDAS